MKINVIRDRDPCSVWLLADAYQVVYVFHATEYKDRVRLY